METIDQTVARITAFIQEQAPTVDLSPGSVLSELLVGLTAQAQNEMQNTVTSLAAASTIQAVLASATDTFNPVIDALASNYDTYRNQGKQATGTITVVVNAARTYYIPQGFTFVQPNLNFTYATTTNYVINATSSPALVQNGGLYQFTIPVQATAIGVEQQVSFGTSFALDPSSSLPEFVSAIAATAFSQGQNQETDKELITRFRLGLSTKNLISPNAIQTVLKDQFPNFQSVAVRGVGDPEEIRGADNPFGIVLPGFTDVYIRMCTAIPTVTFTLPGTSADGSNWTINIPTTSAPGFYKIVSIVPSGTGTTGTLQINSVTYGYDTSLYTTKNIVNSVEEARFSKYQSCTVTFSYSGTSPANFDVTVLAQPNIADIQALFLDNSTRIPCADYLVKAIVPCNVSVGLKLIKNSPLDDLTTDIQSMKQDIFNYINGLAVGDSVSASKIVDICHNYNIKRVDLPILLKGSIYAPFSTTDDIIYVSDSDVLTVPDLPLVGVTPNNTAFFVNYTDVNGNDTISISD